MHPRLCRDDVIHDPVREILLLGSPLMFWNGRTAIDGLSGSGKPREGRCSSIEEGSD